MTDKEIIDAYWKYGTQKKAGEVLGISQTSVYRALKNNNIQVSRKKICECCGREFLSCFEKRRYCSKQCSDYARRNSIKMIAYHKTCKICGAEYDSLRKNSATCSPKCAKSYHGARIGKQRINSTEKWVNEAQIGFEYVSHTKGRIKLKCKCCGSVLERANSTVRDKNVKCEYCKEAEQLQEARQKMACFLIALKDAKTPKQCAACGKMFTSNYPTQKYCSDKCKKSGNTYRSRCKHYGVYYDPSVTRIKVVRRDKNICQICGKTCNPKDKSWGSLGPDFPTLDHIIPLAKGGTHTWSNVQCACAICNSNKRDLEEYAAEVI